MSQDISRTVYSILFYSILFYSIPFYSILYNLEADEEWEGDGDEDEPEGEDGEDPAAQPDPGALGVHDVLYKCKYGIAC